MKLIFSGYPQGVDGPTMMNEPKKQKGLAQKLRLILYQKWIFQRKR